MMIFSLKKYFLGVIYFAFMMVLFSCAEDKASENGGALGSKDSKMQIMLQLPGEDETTRATEAGSTEENLITSVYLSVFDNSGNKEFDIYMDVPYTGSSSEVDMSLWNSERVIIVLNTNVLSTLNTTRNIHVVTNVPESKLLSVTDEASLKALLTETITTEIPSPGVSNPLVMHGVCQGHVFSSNVRAAVSLVRNVSKVRLTVNTTDSNQGGNTISFAPENKISLTTTGVADRSFLVMNGMERNPVGTEYIDYPSKDILLSSSGTGTKSFIMPSLYVNENFGDVVEGILISTPTCLIVQIPFHNGSEVITDNYYKLTINEKNAFVIKRNTIYDITMNIEALGGETPQTAPEITATLNILPWDEKTLTSDLTQTYLSVMSTTLQVAAGVYDFEYATNAEVAKRTVTSDQSWLTVALDSQHDNNLIITATGTGYTVPRTANLSIKVNDLTKVIAVTQEAQPVVDGSISLTPSPIYLSTVHPTRNVALAVTGGASWANLINNLGTATYSPANGTGNANLAFTRGATPGNTDFRFVNLNTLNYADVQVCNLSLTSSVTEIQVPGAGVTNETEVGIVALGGSAGWQVKSKPTWMTVSNSGGNLLYSADPEPSETDRTGTIVLSHVNDPDLTVSITVKQSAKFIVFDEFEHMLITYDWTGSTGRDLDTATEFADRADSPLSSVFPFLSSQPVGYGNLGGLSPSSSAFVFTDKARKSGPTSTNYDNDPNLILRWGGDNRATAGTENLVWYMKNFRTEQNLAALRAKGIRYVYIDLYAIWWGTADVNSEIKLTVKTYRGGRMVRSTETVTDNVDYGTFTYQNTSGTILPHIDSYTESKKLTKKDSGAQATYKTNYVKMAEIRYDIEKNAVSLNSVSTRSVSSSPNYVIDPDYPQILPGESKDDYTERVEEYYKNRK